MVLSDTFGRDPNKSLIKIPNVLRNRFREGRITSNYNDCSILLLSFLCTADLYSYKLIYDTLMFCLVSIYALKNSNVVFYLVSLRYPNAIDEPNQFSKKILIMLTLQDISPIDYFINL